MKEGDKSNYVLVDDPLMGLFLSAMGQHNTITSSIVLSQPFIKFLRTDT